MSKRRKVVIIIIFVVLVSAIFGSAYYFLRKGIIFKFTVEDQKNEKEFCLSDNEQADFKIKRLGEYPSDDYDRGFIEIAVKKINTNQEISRFKIDNIINPSHYHLMELHKCGVYVLKTFNFDYKSSKALTGFKREIWYYDYNGKGESIIFLSGESKSGVLDSAGVPGKLYSFYYFSDFRIDPRESYIVLEQSYLGKDDYAIVIKDLNSKEDVFILFAKSIFEQYPNIAGNFDMLEWSEDSRYFWGNISDGAYVNAYFRIGIQDWKYDIFEVSDGAMGGMPLNVNIGYVPIQPGLVWTGDAELTQELKEKDKKEGKKSSLYLYNLFTKEKILIEAINEPQFFFKPKWLSDTELKYELPNGEKKIYKISEL